MNMHIHIPESKNNALSYRNHKRRVKIIPNIEIVRFNGRFESTFVSLHLTYPGQGENAFGVVKDNRSVIIYRLHGPDPKLIITVVFVKIFYTFSVNPSGFALVSHRD